MFITHNVHGKVKLLAESVPDELKVQLKSGEDPIIVYTADCGPPFSSNVKLEDDSLEDALMGELRAAQAVWDEYDNMYVTPCVTHYSAPTAPSKSAGKQKAATTSAAEPQPPKKKGRPVGSKDKQPRQERSQIMKWEYGGKHGPAGTQFAKLGDDVVHNQMGVGVLVGRRSVWHRPHSAKGNRRRCFCGDGLSCRGEVHHAGW